MLYATTLNEIESNINTGVEYEIALFAKLIESNKIEYECVVNSIKKRYDSNKVKDIMNYSNIFRIINELEKRKLTLLDVTFETQNDNVNKVEEEILSRAATIMSGEELESFKSWFNNWIPFCQMIDDELYSKMYIEEMTKNYGNVNNWFRMRKPSKTTDAYIDLIRDEVISNWPNVNNKTKLLSALFHEDSPIEFWVVTYLKNGYELKTKPQTIDMKRSEDVEVRKYQTSYVAFYLDNVMVGHMQVKFNNGFIERCKKANPDIIHQGVRMSFGQPFSSWNFSVEK